MKETELHDKSIREHFLSWTLKQNSTGFSNFPGWLSVYSLANHEYLKRLTNFVEKSWLWTNDWSLRMLFRWYKLTPSPSNRTRSEILLIKFFHMRKPYLSNGWISPVVWGGIVRISSCLFEGVALEITDLFLYVVKESNKSTLFPPALGKKHL
jgi:hypothetical protein